MSDFPTLMRHADKGRRGSDDPCIVAWWTGYMRGLRRAHHGERFGTDAEHSLWLNALHDPNPNRAALGRGYRAGLTLTALEPGDAQ